MSGNENKLVLVTLQRLLASGIYDTDSGVGWERGGKRGNERVRVKERNVGVGKTVWIAEPADLQEVNISDPTEINKVKLLNTVLAPFIRTIAVSKPRTKCVI